MSKAKKIKFPRGNYRKNWDEVHTPKIYKKDKYSWKQKEYKEEVNSYQATRSQIMDEEDEEMDYQEELAKYQVDKQEQ